MPSRNIDVGGTNVFSPELTNAVERFKQAWSAGEGPNLADFIAGLDFMAGLDPPGRRQALMKLVAVDLEFRRRQDASESPEADSEPVALLESYVETYPELGSTEQLPMALIGAEYRARRQAGERPGHDEYRSRFPRHGEQLIRVLERIDGEWESSLPETADLATTTDHVDHGPPKESGERLQKAALRMTEHFEFREKLGEGGMGAVYSATDRLLGRTVAIKVVRSAWHGNRQMVAQFLSEARLASRLQHPGICPVYEVGLIVPPDAEGSDPVPFIAMKQIEGRTFAEALRARGQDLVSTRGKWLQVLGEVADAVAYAHERGVIHRDLKPANVMLGTHGETQVMDWGLAKFTAGASDRAVAPSNETEATRYGTVKGTWPFMPPEQATGRTDKVDARADVFALGSMLCQILTGRPAYAGETSWVIAAAKAGDLTDAKSRLEASGADDELVALTLDCLQPDPDHRPADAAVFAERVAAFQANVERRLRAAEIEAEKERGERIAAGERLRAARWRLGLAAAVIVFITISLAAAGLYVQSAVVNAEAQRQQVVRLDTQVEALRDAALREPWNDVAWSRYVENRRFALAALREAERRVGWLASVPWIAGRTGDPRAAVDEAGRILSQAEKDRDLCLTLREARVLGTAVKGSYFDTPRQLLGYQDALRAYGVGISDPKAAASTIKASLIRDELVGVLDELLQSSPLLDRLEDFPNSDNMVVVLNDVDPDPVRMRMRKALVRTQDGSGPPVRVELEALADEWDFAAHPVSTSLVFCDVLAKHDLPRAIRSLHQLTQRNPRMFEAHNSLGAAYLMLEPPDRVAALAHLQAAVALAPESPGASLNLANVLSKLERYEEAKALYLRTVELQPDYVDGYENLASLSQDMGSYDEAESYYRKAIELQADNAVAYRGLGQTLLALNRDSEGEACFRKAIELQPEYPSPYHDLALLLKRQGRHDEAESCLRAVIELTEPDQGRAVLPNAGTILPSARPDLNRDNAVARHDLGVMLVGLRRFEEAETLIRRALELAPELSAAHRSLGDLLSGTRRPDEAEASYREAIRLDPNSAAAHVNLGNLLARKQRLDEAAACFRAAIEIEPDLSSAHLGLGNIQFLQKRHDEATKSLQTAVELQPDLVEARSSLAAILVSRQRWDEAESHLRQVIEQQPEFLNAHLNLNVLLQRRHRFDEAAECLQAALEHLPEEAVLHCHLGRVFGILGRFEEAVTSLERGHRRGSSQPGWNVPSARWLGEARRDLVLYERLKEVLEGDAMPSDPEEMVSLARLCQQPSQKLYRRAAALYEEAFEQKPELAELRPNQQHRYDAACAAALAGAEAGAETSGPDTETRSKWREQAREWLEADLSAWTALKDEPAARSVAVQVLNHWLSDPDLESVREQSELAKLPEAERERWELLWSHVREAIDELRP